MAGGLRRLLPNMTVILNLPDTVFISWPMAAGTVLHGRELVIPSAMSDYAGTFATISLDDVLNAMTRA